MGFFDFFIHRPVATTLLTAGIALAGIMAFKLLPVSPLPQVDFPTIQVNAGLPGASPETMASSVATPLERQFTTIAGLDSMSSSSVVAGFTPGLEKLHSGRQRQPRRDPGHLLLDGRLDAARSVIECGRDQILQHLLVVQHRGVDLHSPRLMLAVQGDLDHPAAGFAVDFQHGDFRLGALHRRLHLLRLFHQIPDAAFHRNSKKSTQK